MTVSHSWTKKMKSAEDPIATEYSSQEEGNSLVLMV